MNKNKFFSKINGKKKLILGFMAAAIVSPVILAACGNSEISGNYIAVGLTDPVNPRWQKAKTSLEDSIKSYDYKFASGIFQTQQEQNNFLNAWIGRTNKPKGIVVGEVDDAAAAIASAAKKNNIPFIAYDRLINKSSEYSYYATFNNSLVGELQGLAAASKLLEYKDGNKDAIFKNMTEMENFYYTGNVSTKKSENKNGSSSNSSTTTAVKSTLFNKDVYYYAVAGAPTDNNSKLFYEGETKVMQKLYDITQGKFKNIQSSDGNPKSLDFNTVAVNEWNYTDAQNRAVANFNSYQSSKSEQFKNLKILLAPNDGMADSLIKAYQKYVTNDQWPIVTGQDSNDVALKYIQEGKQFMTIYKPDYKLAKVAVAVLMELIKNPNETPEKILEAIQKDKNIVPFASELSLDQTSYTPSGAPKPVNTFILLPKVITKDNLNEVI